MYVRKNVNFFDKKSSVNNFTTRNKNKFIVPSSRLSKVSKSFMGTVFYCPFYNKIPGNITCLRE